jgi:hypothetical protein
MPPDNDGKFQDCSEPQKTPSLLAYPPEAVFIPSADLKAAQGVFHRPSALQQGKPVIDRW